jgi:hypothetical protein
MVERLRESAKVGRRSPFGDDNQNCNRNSNSNSNGYGNGSRRFPSGMTTRKQPHVNRKCNRNDNGNRK